MNLHIYDEPDRLGYWWAFENLDRVDADWLLVFVDMDGVHYGMVKFEKEHFSMWVKANFTQELVQLNNLTDTDI